MLIVGLTGSIGMGKSVAAQQFRNHGIAVCDADAIVHALYEGEAVAPIAAAFPEAVANGRIDRARLSLTLAKQTEAFAKLEAIVHPLVREKEKQFLAAEAARSAHAAVLEIPLLFETGGDALVDVTIVVSASEDQQRARVLARPGMTEAKLRAILARQLPDAEKRRRADFVVDTSGSPQETADQITALVADLQRIPAEAWLRYWSTTDQNPE